MFFTRFWPKNRVFYQNPRIWRFKNHQKNLKKRWWGIRVFRDFLGQIPVYGTPPDPQTTKNHGFWTPPKIIKNRLNFACSKIPWKPCFPRFKLHPLINQGNLHITANPVKTVVSPYIHDPPPKIIKNRLNFALSKKFI